jgi:hypothetical protein
MRLPSREGEGVNRHRPAGEWSGVFARLRRLNVAMDAHGVTVDCVKAEVDCLRTEVGATLAAVLRLPVATPVAEPAAR